MTAPAYTPRTDDSMFLAADETYAEIKEWLTGVESGEMSESELQRQLEPKGRELMRLLMQSHVTLRCQSVPAEEVVGEDGERRTHVRAGALRQLLTIFGAVEAVRQGFGGRCMDSRFPVDADLNLPKEKYSLEVRRRCALQAARGSYDEGVDALARSTGAAVAKRQFQQLTTRAAQDFDAFYDTTQLDLSAERTGRILVMTSDGKGIVMRFDGLPPATQKAAKKSEQKMTTRLSKGEKANRKRMATVCAVYTLKPWIRTPESLVEHMRGLRDATRKSPRPGPEHKRVWASVTKPAREVIAEAFEEAHLRDPHDDKRWVMLVDGKRHQLRYVREQAKALGVELTIIANFWPFPAPPFLDTLPRREPLASIEVTGVSPSRGASVAALRFAVSATRSARTLTSARTTCSAMRNTCGTTSTLPTACRSRPVSSKGPVATSSPTEWTSPELAGASTERRLYSAYARSAVAATSRSTGHSTSSRSTSGTTHHATLADNDQPSLGPATAGISGS